jgi:uncharacterized protein YxeA
MIWREKKVPLIILAVLLLANALFFFTYRVQYENRLRDLEDNKVQAQMRLQQVRNDRLQIERQIAAYKRAQKDLAVIYNDRWSTEVERFTALVNEVKRLAVASQMVPKSISFSRLDKDSSNKAALAAASGPNGGATGTSIVTISFTVQGSYQQVRRLINLLELSDQFVIIDAVSLSGMAGANANGPLTLNLRLKTIFREPTAPAVKPNQQL